MSVESVFQLALPQVPDLYFRVLGNAQQKLTAGVETQALHACTVCVVVLDEPAHSVVEYLYLYLYLFIRKKVFKYFYFCVAGTRGEAGAIRVELGVVYNARVVVVFLNDLPLLDIPQSFNFFFLIIINT